MLYIRGFMQLQQPISIFWFRRDLRLHDNKGLAIALQSPYPVLPVFIFDTFIIEKLENRQDARITFIYDQLHMLREQIRRTGSSLLVKHGSPLDIYKQLGNEFTIAAVYTNHDYEPYAKNRDNEIRQYLQAKGIHFHSFKDQVIFEGEEILSGSGTPYKVFTPYSKSWLQALSPEHLEPQLTEYAFSNFLQITEAPPFPTLESLGFKRSLLPIPAKAWPDRKIMVYDKRRDYPSEDATTRLGIHLRHGTISIREAVAKAQSLNTTFLKELIWREFYMMILDHNPHVTEQAFKPKYDHIPWQNKEEDFMKWCEGKTGIPTVDAGMRQLNETGFMHNRVRMITASFLCKNLLIDWRWGEAWFVEKLLDYELASNNGGWQWAAGSGVDAQPYFRVFNPEAQVHKFDREYRYIRKWVPEFGTSDYPKPMVDLKESRAKAIVHYKKHLNG